MNTVVNIAMRTHGNPPKTPRGAFRPLDDKSSAWSIRKPYTRTSAHWGRIYALAPEFPRHEYDIALM